MRVKIICSEFTSWAKKWRGKKFHAVLSDPPYGLRFMGKSWDAISAREWGEALIPLLYPGALVFMFGGTRTWHKLATGMEEAGFEIWDTLMWLHGQGFPKAQALDKLIDKNLGNKREVVGKRKRPGGPAGFTADKGWNDGPMKNDDSTVLITKGSETADAWSGHKTAALKPAWEPILCFRAPRQGKNYAELALEYGSGALNVDGGRISTGENLSGGAYAKQGSDRHDGYENWRFKRKGDAGEYKQPKGRYPANLVLDEESAEMLDERTGDVSKGTMGARHTGKHDNLDYGFKEFERGRGFGDKGGPSRFYYCAKASRSEREQGLPKRDDGTSSNDHPTVKPIALTKWLATLLLPSRSIRSRRLLVPFAGSGSELIGAARAGWDKIVGIEMKKISYKIALRRIHKWR